MAQLEEYLINCMKSNSTGNYSCFAENELGKSRGFIELSGDDFNHHDDSDSDSD